MLGEGLVLVESVDRGNSFNMQLTHLRNIAPKNKYVVKVRCGNCGAVYIATIDKGVGKDVYLSSKDCKVCEMPMGA
jgi:uncharacterized Zn finger protein